MFRSTRLILVATVLVLAVLMLPLAASALPHAGTTDTAARFEQPTPGPDSLWDRVVRFWLKVGSDITPNGKD